MIFWIYYYIYDSSMTQGFFLTWRRKKIHNMWQTIETVLVPQSKIQYQIRNKERFLTYREVVDLWRTNSDFREFYTQILAQSDFSAYFWEAPPVTLLHFDMEYEFVLIDSHALARVKPDIRSFSDQFVKDTKNEGVITFNNLSGDSVLVAPCPIISPDTYPHLASFIRKGPDDQIQTFWKKIGEAMLARVNDKPVWLSTAGMGVYWLHARLDSRPKYYRHGDYKKWGY